VAGEALRQVFGWSRRLRIASVVACPMESMAGFAFVVVVDVEEVLGPEEWRRTSTSDITQSVDTISRTNTGPMRHSTTIPLVRVVAVFPNHHGRIPAPALLPLLLAVHKNNNAQ